MTATVTVPRLVASMSRTLEPGDPIRDYRGKWWRFRRAVCPSHPDKIAGQIEAEHTSGAYYQVFYDAMFPGLHITNITSTNEESL